MYIAEAITPPPDTTCWNTDLTGWYGGNFNSVSTIVSEPQPAVDYWREIADKVSLPQHRHTITTPSLPEAPVMNTPLSQSENKGFKNSGVMPIIGPIYHRSKLVRGIINTLAVALAVHTFIPPHQAEASNSLVPIVQQPAGWTCVGEAQARQMDPLCEVGHGMFPCSPDSAYYVDENGYPHFAEKFHSTSSLLGKEWCEFTCESPILAGQPGADAQVSVHTHEWQLTEVCYPVKQKNVATQSTTQVTQPATENYGTTQTAPPPTEYYGTVQTAGQVIDGQAQQMPKNGDGLCSFDMTGPINQSDPDCTLGGLFGGGNSHPAPATENTAPPITEQVPNVPAPVNTTDTTDWQTPTTTGNVGGGTCSEQGLYCAKCVREQIPAIFLAERLKQIGLQCHD